MKDFLSLFPANDFSLIAVVLALPLLGAFVNGVFGRRLGKDAVRLMALAVTRRELRRRRRDVHRARRRGRRDQDDRDGPEHGGAAHEVIKHGHAKLVWTAWEWMRTSGVRDASIPIELKFSVDALSRRDDARRHRRRLPHPPLLDRRTWRRTRPTGASSRT